MRILYMFRDPKGLTLEFCDTRRRRPIPRVGDSWVYWRGQNRYTVRVDEVTWDFNVGQYDVIISGAITATSKAEYNDIKSDSRLYPVRVLVLDALLFGAPLVVSLVLMYLADRYYLQSFEWYVKFPVDFIGLGVCYWLFFLFIVGRAFDSLYDLVIPRPPREITNEETEET